MTAAYVVALSGGATLAAGLTIPIQHAAGLDWRAALAVWGIFPALAAIVWIPQLRHPHVEDASRPKIALRALVRDPIAWNVTLFMGIQSLCFYTTTAWFPDVLRAARRERERRGLAALTLASSVRRRRTRRSGDRGADAQSARPLSAMTILYAVPVAGVLLAPVQLALLWMIVLGLAQGVTLSLALTFIIGRSPDAAHAGPLSSMAQGIGYTLAAVGPFAFGVLRDWTGGWTVPFAASSCCSFR